jgi:hypothetical protein
MQETKELTLEELVRKLADGHNSIVDSLKEVQDKHNYTASTFLPRIDVLETYLESLSRLIEELAKRMGISEEEFKELCTSVINSLKK